MLLLTRKPGQSVIIDGDIRVTVQEVYADRVRLSFEAPQQVRIDREEVHEARKCESEGERC